MASIAAVAIVVDAAAAWSDRSRGRVAAMWRTITAFAAVAVVWLFLAFDFTAIGR